MYIQSHHRIGTVIALVALLMSVSAGMSGLTAQVSGGGAVVVASIDHGMALHSAAPSTNGTEAQLVLGMLLVLAGFVLSLAFNRAERAVPIHVKPKAKGKRTTKKEPHWFLVTMRV